MKEMIALLIAAVLLTNATDAQTPRIPLFKQLPASETGITFANMLKESPSLNIITYEYYYNGGGVGLADFNNDGLTDIFLTANMQYPRLYLNRGNLRFEDITAKAGVAGKKGWHTGVSIADVNGDGLLDIYACYSGPLDPEQRTNELYINNGNLTFTEKAREMGVADAGYSTQATFFDYDRDGDLDLFVINHNNKNLRNFDASIMKKMIDADAGDRLYRNDNNKFTDVTTAAGIISNPLGYGLGVAVSDLNHDGWPDMYVTNDYVEEDYLYINNGDGTFSNKLKEQLGHISNFSMGCDIADINNDGLTDVYTLDMLPADNRRQKLLYMPDNYELYNNTVQNGFHHQLMRNMLQLNNGDGTFSEIGQLSGVYCTDWSWASLFADLNNDGNKDLFVTNGYGRDMTNRDFVKFYANERLKFLKGEPSNNMFKMLQSIPVTPVHDYLFLNKGNLVFDDVSETAGFNLETLSNGAAYADLDNDGDLDMVVNHLNAPAGIYRNTLVENGGGKDWIAFQLKGSGRNTQAIGAKVMVYVSGKKLTLENYPVRGFQSSMHIPLHTGLPGTQIDSVLVIWPDGTQQKSGPVKLNTINTITYKPSPVAPATIEKNVVFHPVPSSIPFIHSETEKNDFKVQPLMANMISHGGPRAIRGDVNGDKLDDIYLCGPAGKPGALYIQQADGSFVPDSQPAFESARDAEDTDAVFFDADNDGDLDLYVASGGFQVNDGDPMLQDRLYLNNNGRFREFTEELPKETLSAGCVAAGDFDKDGDIDIFTGSRVTPGRYPESPESFLLINDGRAGFSRLQSSLFDSLGMTTDAYFIDLDKDGRDELVTCGEWSAIRIFGYDKGQVQEMTGKFFEHQLNGWWNRLHFSDVDGDGDADLIAGNWGMNSSLQVTPDSPAVLYYGDFDNNGSVDPLICYYIQGKSYPMASRDEITDQMVSLRQKFPTYDSYSNSQVNDILDAEQLKSARMLKADYLRTSWFENLNGKFRLRELPVQAGFFPVYGIATDDFDKDGHTDILLAGNSDHARIKIGKIDAGFGLLLKGDGKGNFEYIPQLQSGLSVKGCTRDIVLIKDKNQNRVVFTINNQPLQMYTY